MGWNWKVSLVIVLSAILWAGFAPREPPDVTLDPIIVQGPPASCAVVSGPLRWNDELVWYSILCPLGVEPDE